MAGKRWVLRGGRHPSGLMLRGWQGPAPALQYGPSAFRGHGCLHGAAIGVLARGCHKGSARPMHTWWPTRGGAEAVCGAAGSFQGVGVGGG